MADRDTRMPVDVAIIGTGPHPDESTNADGYSMGYRHARSYANNDESRLTACCDLVPEHASSFATEFDLPERAVYSDHTAMLSETDPDVVSVCTPPGTHVDIVLDCARAGVAGVHCEKPIASTFGDSRLLVQECDRRGVQLTFNLQNRTGDVAKTARSAIEDDVIGDVERVEARRSDLLQTGLHNVDLCNYLAGDPTPNWVMGQVDVSEENVWYTDMYSENQGVGIWSYENGASGIVITGDDSESVLDAHVRALGTDGILELRMWNDTPLRVRDRNENGWRALDAKADDAQDAAIDDVVAALTEGRQPALHANRALAATELVFGIWESARRGGRVDLPLTVDDNPLDSIVAEQMSNK